MCQCGISVIICKVRLLHLFVWWCLEGHARWLEWSTWDFQ